MTPREAALLALGLADVEAYERVKTFYTRLGLAFEESFARRVGGRLGGRGEPDVITRLGGWEFCAAATTKNSAGERAQLARVGPGRIVQVSGRLGRGHISAVEFLRIHGIREPERAAGECQAAAVGAARRLAEQGGQLPLSGGPGIR